jgi:profilin
MSAWDAYIDALMVDLPKGGRLSSCALVGIDGASVWAASPDFPEPTEEQVDAIMAGFKSVEEHGHAGELGANGIKLADRKFQVVPCDESVMRGKCLGGGCCIKRASTVLVVGIYEEPVAAGDCNIIIENMGDSLKESGY